LTIQTNTRAILCDPERIQARNIHVARLQALFAGEQPRGVFRLFGVRGVGRCDPYTEPERWIAEALDDLATKAGALRDEAVFRPLVVEFGPYGVHFIDKILGAEVFDLDGTGNWQVHLLDTPIGALALPDLDRDPTWQLARRAAEAFLAAGVTVPLFGLPVIASALNIAVNLYGQAILVALATAPKAAQRDLEVINTLLCTLHRWYRDHIPAAQLQPVVADQRTQPPGFGQLCGCTTHLISGRMYREHIAALDEALLAVYPHGGMIHLCGTHAQHIPVWRALPALRAVQLNDRAAEDLPRYFNGLRDDQILYVNPCEQMPAERILDITGGRRLVLVTPSI